MASGIIWEKLLRAQLEAAIQVLSGDMALVSISTAAELIKSVSMICRDQEPLDSYRTANNTTDQRAFTAKLAPVVQRCTPVWSLETGVRSWGDCAVDDNNPWGGSENSDDLFTTQTLKDTCTVAGTSVMSPDER